MAGDAFILGAGFSKAISPEMPVLSELPNYLREPNREAPWENTLASVNNNVEHMMTLLAQPQPWLSEAENLENRAQFLRFSARLAVVMLERERAAIVTRVFCPEWLAMLVEMWADESAVVVSFNYDTFVEKVYANQEPLASVVTHFPNGKQRDKRSSHDLYVVPFLSTMERRGAVWKGRGRADLSFRFLKLHGSVNWYYSGTPNATGEVLYFMETFFSWLPDPTPDQFPRYALPPDKVPLVVPPTVDKSPFLNHESIRAQWASARFELEYAPNVYFIGYSMPETDLMVRFMVQHALRDSQQKVFVVNRAVDAKGNSRVDAVCAAYDSLNLPCEMNYDYVRAEEVLPQFVQDRLNGGAQ